LDFACIQSGPRDSFDLRLILIHGHAMAPTLRIVADNMSRYRKQRVVIVNQPGAAALTSAMASQTAPDGYMLHAPVQPG